VIFAPVRLFDRLLLAIVGEENAILHNFLRILTAVAAATLAGLAAPLVAAFLVPPEGNPLPVEPPAPVPEPLRLQPIAPQTVEAGKPLTVASVVEDAQRWRGKLRFTLGGNSPPGARIDPESGTFTWTPTQDQGPRKYELPMSVEGPEGQKDDTSFTVTVTKPIVLRLQPIAPQSIEAGKHLAVPVLVTDAEAWRGKLRFGLGPGAPFGATIDPTSGAFAWTPSEDMRPRKYDVVVSVEGPDGRKDQTSFTITVTTPKEIVLDLGGGVKMELVLIPAGSFVMGSPESDSRAHPSEKPQHQVRITRPFYLGKHEVTQEQWEALVGHNPSRFKGPKNPVEQVSWEDCQKFFEKLEAKLGASGAKFRLPTDAEWEYACRAGSTSQYAFGDEEASLGDYAWLTGNAGDKTSPVGRKKPNPWGLYDMQGNVWEWCADWNTGDYYLDCPIEDPTGPTSGSSRVLRGGSWFTDASYSRSAYHAGRPPTYRDSSFGFRVVCVRSAGASESAAAMRSEPLLLKPIAPQKIEVGSQLRVVVSVEEAKQWEGKVRFTLVSDTTPGARIDPEKGVFTWTPTEKQRPGKYDVDVSVEAPDGRRARMTFAVAVTEPGPPAPKEITFDLAGGVTLEMVLIPAGSFLMGSPDSDSRAHPSEKPQRHVRITRPFYLGKHEVTQEQWEAVMGYNPSRFTGPKNPVEQVSWEDCQGFLEKLEVTLGAAGAKFRLPTSAEWECACRAGSTSRYSFGDDEANLGDYAWHSGNTGGKTHPVGRKKPNAWGLYDMHGNVWEWCADWYAGDDRSQRPVEDPIGPSSGSGRVLRGGSWFNDASYCRSAFHGLRSPTFRNSSYGFRVACVR